MPFSYIKEKGIKTPSKNSGVTFPSLAGISLFQNRQFFWLRFNALAAPSQDKNQSQWHLQQAHLYSGGTASAYTDFSIKLTHLFLYSVIKTLYYLFVCLCDIIS